MEKVDELRDRCGFPFVITSGYRSPQHPIEAKKDVPGTHAQGIAADIKITLCPPVHDNKRGFSYGFRWDWRC